MKPAKQVIAIKTAMEIVHLMSISILSKQKTSSSELDDSKSTKPTIEFHERVSTLFRPLNIHNSRLNTLR